MKAVVCLSAALPLSLSAQVTINPNPARVIGQTSVVVRSFAPNLVEGKELWQPQSVAVDTSANPPILYVSDLLNNRVLAWRDATRAGAGVAADLVVGQRDFFATSALGPGTSYRSGLSQPTGIAVDRQGNLYVVDTGNNRILRYPRPFDHTGDAQNADLVIGQPNLDSERANYVPVGQPAPTANNIAVFVGSNLYRTALAFDSAGNLYFTDSGNNRVLRYRAGDLSSPAQNAPSADLVLGQIDFVSNRTTLNPNNAQSYLDKTQLMTPGGLALGAGGQGQLFVSDSLGRVLVYDVAGIGTGRGATRIMGLPSSQPGGPLPPVNEWTFSDPEGIVVIGDRPAVVDSKNNRIAIFNPIAQWPAETAAAYSPNAVDFIGQPDKNTGTAKAGSAGLTAPVQAVYVNGDLYVADSGNNRVIVFPQPTGSSSAASRVIGQPGFDFNSPNLIEGRELFLAIPGGDSRGGIALDTKSDPPHLYIADTFNNRILGYRDMRRIMTGATADLVIGQQDLRHSVANWGSSLSTIPSPSGGLLAPAGLVVDANGDLFVADTGNSRILRFPNPFAQTGAQRPNLVLGQANLSSKTTEPGRSTMSAPYGLALTPEGYLLASDAAHNRVLMFKRAPGGDFSSGMAAGAVFGQPDFLSTTATAGDPNVPRAPRGIASDTSARLYVADTGNNRIMIFSAVSAVEGPGPIPVARLTGLGNPTSVYVSPVTGEIWVADLQNSRVLKYPEYNSLPVTNYQPFANSTIQSPGPLSIALDPSGNLVVADAANRVAMYFPAMVGVNGANFIANRALAPGAIASLFPLGGTLSTATQNFNELPNPVPLPTTLGDVQVTMNDQPVRLYFVSPGQINFLVPMSAPSSGTVNMVVMRASTGQVLASGSIAMNVASPALFTSPSGGSGQVAALNQDNSVNSPSSAAARGEVIQMFGTGQGFVSGAPPDGDVASGLTPTPDPKPLVFIEPKFVPPENIEYSGLAPGLIGVWQINVRIPTQDVAPGQRQIFIQHRDIPSRVPPIQTVISVK